MDGNQQFRIKALRTQACALALGAATGVFLAVPLPVVAQPSMATEASGNLSAATIRRVQHSLIQGGYDVDAADGVWGPRTAAAVREFQRAKGLQATGRADAQTLAALGVTANGTRPPAAMPMPAVRARTPADLGRATIRAVQQALNQKGMQVGPVDGVWGEKTTTAIANLQRAHGMAASGELDAYTLTVLGLLPGSPQHVDAWRSGRAPVPADLDPAAIRLVQQSLNERGFNVGTPDGMWGDRTVSALRDFQRTQGIEPAGAPDIYTLAALGLLPGTDARSLARRQGR
jgi:peptidoglycan hydrolase-like protein with peptidoglycan-binding domain